MRSNAGGLEFGLEAGALGVKEFEVAEGAALVGGADEVGGLAGGCEGIADSGGLLGSIAGLRKAGLHIVDGAEDGLPVVGDGFFAGGHLAFHVVMDERPTRDWKADTGANTPDFAVGGEEGIHVIAQIATGAGEPHGREVSGFGDANVGIT